MCIFCVQIEAEREREREREREERERQIEREREIWNKLLSINFQAHLIPKEMCKLTLFVR